MVQLILFLGGTFILLGSLWGAYSATKNFDSVLKKILVFIAVFVLLLGLYSSIFMVIIKTRLK